MVVLKDDYVLVGIGGCEGIGRITQTDFHPKTHLVWLVDGSMPMAVLRGEDLLTPIDPALYPILSDSTKEE